MPMGRHAAASSVGAASRTTAAPLLRIDGLNQYYGGSHILRNVASSGLPE